MDEKGYAGLLLRISLAVLFLYFGIDKLTSLESSTLTFEGLWLVSLVPLSAGVLVIVAGIAELIIGTALVAGVKTKVFSVAAAIWTLLILLQLGYPAGVYDFSISLAAMALYFTGAGKYSLSNKFK